MLVPEEKKRTGIDRHHLHLNAIPLLACLPFSSFKPTVANRCQKGMGEKLGKGSQIRTGYFTQIRKKIT